jgi:hypothetical protein
LYIATSFNLGDKNFINSILQPADVGAKAARGRRHRGAHRMTSSTASPTMARCWTSKMLQEFAF